MEIRRHQTRLSEAALSGLTSGLRFAHVPAFVIQHGHVIHANPSARALLCYSPILRVEDGVLLTRRQDEAAAIAATLEGLELGGTFSTLLLSSRQSLPIILLHFQPLDLAESGRLVVVRATDLHARPALAPAGLRDIFGLTRGEARIAACLLADPSIAAVAKTLLLSPETVRSHLKRLMARLGVHSQAQLLGVLAQASAGCAPADLADDN